MNRGTLLLLLAVALLPACREEATVPTRQDTLARLSVDQVLYDTEHVMTRKGVRRAILHADSAYFRDNDSRVDLRGVRLEFFNEQTGAVSGTLTSQTGEYDVQTGAMISRGNAVLTLAEGNRRIESEELNYDLQADRVWSAKPTVMRENGREMRGESFESDTRFQNLTVHRAKVTGIKPSDEGGQIRF